MLSLLFDHFRAPHSGVGATAPEVPGQAARESGFDQVFRETDSEKATSMHRGPGKEGAGAEVSASMGRTEKPEAAVSKPRHSELSPDGSDRIASEPTGSEPDADIAERPTLRNGEPPAEAAKDQISVLLAAGPDGISPTATIGTSVHLPAETTIANVPVSTAKLSGPATGYWTKAGLSGGHAAKQNDTMPNAIAPTAVNAPNVVNDTVASAHSKPTAQVPAIEETAAQTARPTTESLQAKHPPAAYQERHGGMRTAAGSPLILGPWSAVEKMISEPLTMTLAEDMAFRQQDAETGRRSTQLNEVGLPLKPSAATALPPVRIGGAARTSGGSQSPGTRVVVESARPFAVSRAGDPGLYPAAGPEVARAGLGIPQGLPGHAMPIVAQQQSQLAGKNTITDGPGGAQPISVEARSQQQTPAANSGAASELPASTLLVRAAIREGRTTGMHAPAGSTMVSIVASAKSGRQPNDMMSIPDGGPATHLGMEKAPVHAPLAPTPLPALPPQTLGQIAEVVQQMPQRPVEIALSPEELGRVRLSISAQDAGITLAVQAERPETLELLRRNIDLLQRELQDLGYEEISFSFGSGQNDGPTGEESRHELSATSEPATTPSIDPTPQIAIRALGYDGGLDIRL